MGCRLSFASAALAVAACLSWTSAASGQVLPAEHRIPGLFGSGGSDGRQQLDLTVSALAANDDDLILQDLESGLGGLSPQRSSSYESLAFQLGYVRRFRESTFGATARSVAQHFQGLGAGNSIGVQRALSLGYDLHHRGTRIAVEQSVNAFPLFAVQAVPSLFSAGIAQLPPPVTDDAVAAVSALRYITSADVTQALGNRVFFTASARMLNTTLSGGAASVRQDIASAHLTFHLARDLGLVTGYGVQQASYRYASIGGTDRTDLQNIDLGLNYDHALSFSRRTTVAFTSGPVLVRNPVTRTTQYTMGGEARLNHQMARSWQATAAYTRGVSFMDGFVSPFLGDTVAVNIGGNLRRRVGLAIGGGFWSGRVVGAASEQAAADRNESLTGMSRLSITISPTMALSAEYRYFHYRFNTAPLLFDAVPLWVDRGSLRIGLDVRLPLFH